VLLVEDDEVALKIAITVRSAMTVDTSWIDMLAGFSPIWYSPQDAARFLQKEGHAAASRQCSRRSPPRDEQRLPSSPPSRAKSAGFSRVGAKPSTNYRVKTGCVIRRIRAVALADWA